MNMKREYQYLLSALVLVGFGIVAFQTNSDTVSIVACLTGLVCVYMAAAASIWNYVFAFINIILFCYMFLEAELYSDATLQIIFFVLNIYGLVIWLTKKGEQKVRPTTRMTKKEWIGSMIILPIGVVCLIPIVTVVWSFLLQKPVTPAMPYLDATMAVLSIIAQYFLAKKKLENWYFWIMVDVLSIFLYISKGLHTVAFTYAVFLVICIFGAYHWTKEWKKENGIVEEKTTNGVKAV